MLKKIIKVVSFVIIVGLIINSCQKDDLTTIKEQETTSKSLYKQRTLSLSEIPKIEQKIIEKTNPDIFNRTEDTNTNQAIFETENILEIIDTLNNANYSIQFRFANTPISTFYNLVVGETPNGEVLTPFVMRYVCDDAYLDQYIESGFNINYFVGKMAMHKYTDFFALGEFDRTETLCPPQFDDVGDPISCVEEPFNGGSGGGGSTGGPVGDGGSTGGTGGDEGSGVYDCEWTTETLTCIDHEPGGICGGQVTVITLNCVEQNTSAFPDGETGRTVEDDCPDCTAPDGGVGVNPISLATMSATLKHNLDLSPEANQWLANGDNSVAIISLYEYYINHISPATNTITAETKEFLEGLFEAIKDDLSVDLNALNFVFQAQNQDKIFNDLDSNFLVSVNQYTQINLSDSSIHDPVMMHFKIKMAVLRSLNPEWSEWKIFWEATKDVIHISLDVFGLIPVVGEIADLANGVLYTIEGDGVNASLSFAAALPVVGTGSTIAKYGLKIVEASSIGTKVKLVWKVTSDGINFGYSSKLRKVLGITDSALQAHHLIPWATRNHDVIQKAAKSSNPFHMNEALNGIPVASWRNQPNHNIYNNLIESKLDEFNTIINPNATANEAYDFVYDLISDIRNWVINNPNSHLNELILP